MVIPELLAPAGSPEALDAAIGEGADAVYLGLKNFNARMRSSNFSYAQFEGALRTLHRMHRKMYVTVNTIFEQRESDRMFQLLKYLADTGPDGLIVQDFGVVQMCRDYFPHLKLHASTQMNIASARGVNVLSRYGMTRVVLARELNCDEIRTIRESTTMELEIFVHGALCVSASGLCLFSSFLGGKSANRGMCTQACRRLYMHGDEYGYYFSPFDLQLIEAVPELAEIGINALKIEGRMKSASYVATAVSAYRNVLDSLNGSESQIHDAINAGESILQKDFARSKTAFYFDSPEARWLDPQQNGGTGISLGKILAVKGSINSPTKSKWARIHAASLQHGDSIRIHRADDSDRQTQKIQDIEPAGEDVWIPIPEAFTAGDSVYLIQTKENPKHYAPVIPNNDKGFRRKPGFDHAPSVHLNPLEKLHRLPEGLYAAVSRIEDLYIVQSVRPVKVFVHLNRSTAPALLKNLPFSPAEIVPMLDPYFPQKDESALAPEIQSLLDYGYRYFAVNNPGHFSYFRGTDAILIAGPYLYSFNRYAASFISRLGASYLVTPLEQNRQNVERTFGQSERNRIFVTVFAYPALFRIRADLSSIYRFNAFSDNREAHFQLLPSPDGSVVLPERPFSILDKIHFLQESGFSHFLIDLQGPHLKKVDYKDLMAAAHGNKAIPDISRFNWKDGFYQVKDD